LITGMNSIQGHGGAGRRLLFMQGSHIRLSAHSEGKSFGSADTCVSCARVAVLRVVRRHASLVEQARHGSLSLQDPRPLYRPQC
jgi:hypothetical protein